MIQSKLGSQGLEEEEVGLSWVDPDGLELLDCCPPFPPRLLLVPRLLVPKESRRIWSCPPWSCLATALAEERERELDKKAAAAAGGSSDA